jgi:hypothetical protein
VKVRVFGVMAWLAACAVPGVALAASQGPPPVQAQQDAADREADRVRFQMSVMEGVLQSAAENGARQTAQELKSVVPDAVLWSGAPRARGFRVDNYGYFFDVEVPTMRASVTYSMELLDRNQAAAQEQLLRDIQTLHGQLQLVSDARTRDSLMQMLKRIEAQLGADVAPSPADPRATNVSSTTPARPPKPIDPVELYTSRVKDALIDAILDHSAPLLVRPDEWLTVAARAAQTDDLTTWFLRIRGSDLAALHTGKLSREEARKRVEVKEF